MRIGYARVSTLEQNPELQLDELKNAGCKNVYVDKASGAKADRPELQDMLGNLREGDVVVVWKLDRLGRSLKHLLEIIEDLEQKGVGFVSLTEGFDTTTSSGKMMFSIFGALGEFERNLIRERTHAGLAAARARGRLGGRKKKLTAEDVKAMRALYDNKQIPVTAICKRFNITRPTMHRYLSADPT